MAVPVAFPTPGATAVKAIGKGPLGGLASFSLGGIAASSALGLVQALFKPNRAIGTIIAGVTVDEIGRDDLEITRHPVELGAQITDHAYKLPAEIIIRCGWTGSGHLPGYIDAVYDALLTLQFSRVPFTVTTGKRTYPNMLISSIGQTTDSTTENALMCQVTCRHIIIVETQVTNVAPRAAQADPANTAPTEKPGDKQPVAAPDISIGRSLGNLAGSAGRGILGWFGASPTAAPIPPGG